MNLYLKSFLIIAVISIIGVGGFFAWNHFNSPAEEKAKVEKPTIDEVLKKSVDTEEITTNFADGGFIKTKFKIITTSENNAEEIKKLDFRVEDTIIKSFNSMKKEEASGPKGFTLIEKSLKDKLNKELGSNYITRVYMVDKMIQ